MKFRFIRNHRRQFRVTSMCRVLGVSRSGYHSWLSRPESRRAAANRELAARIRHIHKDSRQTYGSPRVHGALSKEGIRCGRKRVARLMKVYGIWGRSKRKFKATTNSKHSLPVAPNLLKRDFSAQRPDQVWASDITYIRTEEGWLYLSVVMDLYSRRIVGWAMRDRLTQELALDALQMALKSRRPVPGLIHHSDRGSQYAGHAYQKLLSCHGIRPSMSRKGDCYDNAVVESFFGSLKSEWVYHQRYRSRQEAMLDIFDYIEVFYNRKRLHSYLGNRSPVEMEQLPLAA